MLRATVMVMLLTTVMVWVRMPSTCFFSLLVYFEIADCINLFRASMWTVHLQSIISLRILTPKSICNNNANPKFYFSTYLSDGWHYYLWPVLIVYITHPSGGPCEVWQPGSRDRRSRTTGKNGKKQSKKRQKNIAFFQSSESAIFTARAQNFFTEYGYRIRLVRLSNTVGTSSPNTVGTLFGDGIANFPESFFAIFCDS